jgi:translation initiation factor 3 subunit L
MPSPKYYSSKKLITSAPVQVLNVLHSMVDKSNINKQLEVYTTGGNPDSVAGEFGRHPIYKMMGYFSLVGLLRLHSLLGDYHQAIKVIVLLL